MWKIEKDGKVYLSWWVPAVIFAVVAALTFMLVSSCVAQWEEIPDTGTTIDFGGIFNSEATAVSGTAIHAEESYWLGLTGSQIGSHEEIISQDLGARAQAGVWFKGISLQGFVEFDRDLSDENTYTTGAYGRKKFEFDKLDLIFAVGSMVEGEDKKDEFGLEEDSVDVLPYYISIVGVEYDFRDNVGIFGKVIGNPSLDFSKTKGDFILGADIALDTNLMLKIQSQTEFEFSDGDSSVETESSILLSILLD